MRFENLFNFEQVFEFFKLKSNLNFLKFDISIAIFYTLSDLLFIISMSFNINLLIVFFIKFSIFLRQKLNNLKVSTFLLILLLYIYLLDYLYSYYILLQA
jgi:hypothetical protein